jgi:hypothetical protein
MVKVERREKFLADLKRRSDFGGGRESAGAAEGDEQSEMLRQHGLAIFAAISHVFDDV